MKIAQLLDLLQKSPTQHSESFKKATQLFLSLDMDISVESTSQLALYCTRVLLDRPLVVEGDVKERTCIFQRFFMWTVLPSIDKLLRTLIGMNSTVVEHLSSSCGALPAQSTVRLTLTDLLSASQKNQQLRDILVEQKHVNIIIMWVMQYERDTGIHGECLHVLLKTLPLPLIMRTTFMILCGKTSPGWLKSQCGNFLTSILLESGGLHAFLLLFLHDQDQMDTESVDHVTRILLTYPKNVGKEGYILNITDQMIRLLSVAKTARSNALGQIFSVILSEGIWCLVFEQKLSELFNKNKDSPELMILSYNILILNLPPKTVVVKYGSHLYFSMAYTVMDISDVQHRDLIMELAFLLANEDLRSLVKWYMGDRLSVVESIGGLILQGNDQRAQRPVELAKFTRLIAHLLKSFDKACQLVDEVLREFSKCDLSTENDLYCSMKLTSLLMEIPYSGLRGHLTETGNLQIVLERHLRSNDEHTQMLVLAFLTKHYSLFEGQQVDGIRKTLECLYPNMTKDVKKAINVALSQLYMIATPTSDQSYHLQSIKEELSSDIPADRLYGLVQLSRVIGELGPHIELELIVLLLSFAGDEMYVKIQTINSELACSEIAKKSVSVLALIVTQAFGNHSSIVKHIMDAYCDLCIKNEHLIILYNEMFYEILTQSNKALPAQVRGCLHDRLQMMLKMYPNMSSVLRYSMVSLLDKLLVTVN